MSKHLLSLTALLMLAAVTSVPAQVQQPAQRSVGYRVLELVTGVVINAQQQPVESATISVDGQMMTTGTDQEGWFRLRASFRGGPVVLIIAAQGMVTQELVLEQVPIDAIRIVLAEAAVDMGQTTRAASRREENVFKVPVTLDHLSADHLMRSAAPDPVFGALAGLRSVDLTSNSMLVTNFSTRGFNSTQTARTVQLTDQVDGQVPSLGFNLGNLLGAAPLDIATVDVIHGPSSALYGVNAFNGVLVTTTKDPFQTPGMSVQVRGGTQHTGDVQLRYALRLGPKWAAKVNLGYFQADDWLADNMAPITAALEPANHSAIDDRGYNAVNRYGDVGYTYGAEGGALTGQRVFMPGWTESELMGEAYHRQALSIRVNPTLTCQLTPRLRATYEYRFSQLGGTFQSLDRYRLDNVNYQLHRIELATPQWTLRAYQAQEGGEGLVPLNAAGGLLQNLPDPASGGQLTYAQRYFATYAQTYNQWLLSHPGDEQGARATAHTAASPIQMSAGTASFEHELEEVQETPIGKGGVQIPGRSRLSEVSGQYDFRLKGLSLLAGGNFRQIQLLSVAPIFLGQEETKGPTNYQFGGYAEAAKALFNRRLRLTLAGRVDMFQNFKPALSPRAGATLLIGAKRNHALRASMGQAYTAPTQTQQYLRLDLGQALVQGNAKGGFEGYDLQVLQPGTSPETARTTIAPLGLEKARTLEIGYRTLLGQKLLVDINYFHTDYANFLDRRTFIGRTDGTLPTATDLATFGQPGSAARLLSTWYNEDALLGFNGVSAEIRWFVSHDLAVWTNYSFYHFAETLTEAEAEEQSHHDAAPDGLFSGPRQKFNLGLTGTSGPLRYDVSARWTASYAFYSTFAEGDLPERTILDAQLGYVVAKTGLTIMAGGTNLTNSANVSVYGGPSIGRQIMAGLRFDMVH